MTLGKNKKNLKIVYVGMSGGVDSSVSAALLKKAGYQVVGVFIKPWDPADDPEVNWGISCNWRAERRDAMRVAAHLNVPLLTLDASREYKEKVIDYLLSEYREGRTPNPDVMCNKQIKFGVFYDYAINQGADFVATGHYSQIDVKGQKIKNINSVYQLRTSKDENKDQSYFLWNLKQEQLAHILFPIGGYKKEKVRKLAKKMGLPNADKKDSQGLCFIGRIDFKKFLTGQIPVQRGNVLNETGEIVGYHNGAFFLTIGERHGFIIEKKTPNQKPYFVIAKDIKKNTVTVSSEPSKTKEVSGAFDIKDINWINETPNICQRYQARYRHRQLLLNGQFVTVTKEKATFRFDKPQLKPSGQSLVIYDGSVCMGGGVIK